MLCIALLTFVTLERISPAHAAVDNQQTSIIYVLADAPAIDAEQSGDSQQTPGTPAQSHHCCMAHCSGLLPAFEGATLLAYSSFRVAVPRSDYGTAINLPDGLDRPPKATTIA